MTPRNIFADLPESAAAEEFRDLLRRDAFRLERISSRGHATDWMEQDEAEWVLLLEGAARLEFADGRAVSLRRGDFLDIPAGCRHRVAWTDPARSTVWLALHYR